jgi:PIN domain nuclease of toxin-antitoxin system
MAINFQQAEVRLSRSWHSQQLAKMTRQVCISIAKDAKRRIYTRQEFWTDTKICVNFLFHLL